MPESAGDHGAALAIRAEAGEVRRASAWLEQHAARMGVPADQVGRLELCLNEALANVIAHGVNADVDAVLLRLDIDDEGENHVATVTITDAGSPFDPTGAEIPSRPDSLAEAEPGGLGLVMIRSFSDAVDYRHTEGRNHLSFGVRWHRGDALASRAFRFKRHDDRRKDDGLNDIDRRKHERRVRDLNWIRLFRDADPQAVTEALADCEVLELPAGARLLVPGTTNDSIYVPLSGGVVAHLAEGAGPDAAIPIPPGECVGELSAIDGNAVSALVIAVTRVRVLKLSREVFWGRLMTLPRVARNLRLILSERMRRTNELALRAQREHLELLHLRKELDVARQLQVSMLPMQRPMFADRSDIDICGLMEPTTHIGGDLFDAFFVQERRLFFCVGDVSGHGVVAALFMARAIGLLRVLAMTVRKPEKLLQQLNERLCVGNDTNIFVTLLCGFLDLDSGEMVYSNGGHCPPILRTAEGCRLVPIPKGPLIGAVPGMVYRSMQLTLRPGDLLYCYTDGVTEAQSASGEEFSEARCMRILETVAADAPLSQVLDAVRHDVALFTGNMALADDCTMLALRLPVAS